MAKKLIIVPGMGNKSAEEFKVEVSDAFKNAFNLYQKYYGMSAEDFVEIIPFEYNDIFDQDREKMSNQAQPIVDRLDTLDSLDNGSESLTKKAIEEISKIEAGINDDDFFKTHWLDVFFYRFTILGEMVRIKLSNLIDKSILDLGGNAQRLHILGHSLGTSVLHDTLAKQYSDQFQTSKVKKLSVNTHKLGSLHLIANTSRVLESFIKVNLSTVKPGRRGCVHKYLEYRHIFDPITWPRAFNPSDNGNWISSDSWNIFKRYKLQRLTSVTNEHGNVHDINHYILNPLVHRELFSDVFGIKLTEDEKNEGYENYYSKTFGKVADDLDESLSKLKSFNIENIKGLFKSIKALKDFVEGAGGDFL